MDSALRLSSGGAMPLLGLGTWQGEGEEGKKAIVYAIELGYRHIDTAFNYKNEKVVGEALKDCFDRKIVTREEVFVTTKLPNNGHRKVEHFLKRSLQDLGLDYVDLYLIHWPVPTQYVDDATNLPKDADNKVLLDEKLDPLDTWKSMEACVDQGLTKSIGLSNYDSKQIKHIYDNSRIKPSNLQVEVHLYLNQEKLFKFCSDLDISVTAYAPLGSSGLPGFAKKLYNIDAPARKILLEDPVLQAIAKKYHKTPAQVALRSLIQRGIMVIPKSANEKRIRENSQIFDFALSGEDEEELNALDCSLRYFSYEVVPEFVASPKYPFKEPF